MRAELKYWKEQHFKGSDIYYYWYIADAKRNGVHFHGVKSDKLSEFLSVNRYSFGTYGIEVHSVKAMYEGQTPISNCRVTGGDCYCDGTSLYAEERLGHVNPDNCDAEVWGVLENFYDDKFRTKP